MANLRIEELNTGTTLASITDNDLIPIVDSSTLKTYPVEASKLKTYVGFGAGGTYTALTNLASSGATTIVVDDVPDGLILNTVWAVIDPWTAECEIRKVTGISSTTLTIAATGYDHAADDAVILMWEPEVSVKWFGARGDGSTDDITPITRAITQAYNQGIVKVKLPIGIYPVSSNVLVKTKGTLEGYGRGLTSPYGTEIQAKSGFTDTNLVTLGDTGTQAHDTWLRNLCVDANNIAAVGVFSDSINELSGMENVYVANATSIDVNIDSTATQAGNYTLKTLWIGFDDAAGTEIGLQIKDDSTGGSVSHRGVDDITVHGNPTILAGIYLEDVRGAYLSRVHVEGCTDGIRLGTASYPCRNIVITGVTGMSDVTNVIHIGSHADTNNIDIIGVFPHSATNVILDDLNSKTLSGEAGLGRYHIGDFWQVSGTGFRQQYDLWFQDNVAANQSAVELVRADQVGAAPDGFINSLILGRACAITGVWVKLNANQSAGSLTVTVLKNGVAQSLTAVIDTATSFDSTFVIRGASGLSCNAGDRISLTITTDAGWLPTTADLRAGIEVEV